MALAIAAIVPFAIACSRAAGDTEWRDDLTLLRATGLALSPMGALPSTVLVAASGLLPLGPHAFRGALVAALCLSLVSVLILEIARRALLAIAPAPRLALGLSLLAALTAALSPVLQREATVAGGATLAAALVLAPIALLAGGALRENRTFALVGVAIALASLESFAAGAAAIAVTLAAALAGGSPARVDGAAPRRALAAVVIAGVVTFALVALPCALRGGAEHGWGDAAASLRLREMVALDVSSLRARGASAWLADIGILGCALSASGLIAGVLRPRARWLVAPLAAILLLDLLARPTNAGILTGDPLVAIRTASVCAAALLAAMGVHAVVTTLLVSRIAFARAASALLVAFATTLVALSHEEANLRVARGDHRAPSAFTDHALQRLPPFAVVLARADALSWRVWSARLTSGARPDVTLIPLPLLTRGDLATKLLEEEPSLVGLLRDLSLTGLPSEYALSSVADVRPLYVELDPKWDRRLATHVVEDKLWLRYAPQPLGASDRRLAQTDELRAVHHVADLAKGDGNDDEATLEVIAEHARVSIIAASMVNDHEAVDRGVGLLTAVGREPTVNDGIWSFVVPPKAIDARAGARRRAR